MSLEDHLAALVANVAERHRGLRLAVDVPPHPGRRIEAVPRQEPPSVGGDQVDRIQDVVEHPLGEEVVEVHPHPARLDALASGGDLAFELVRPIQIDAEEPVPVRARARAAAPRLDPEQVVQERHDEVVVQVPLLVAHDERHDRQPRQVVAPEDLDIGVLLPPMHRTVGERLLARADRLGADGLLELEHEARPDRLHDRGRAAFLTVLDVIEVPVLRRVHVRDRAAAGDARHAVAEEVPARDEHPRGARPAHELVRRDEHGILVVEPGVGRPVGGDISMST